MTIILSNIRENNLEWLKLMRMISNTTKKRIHLPTIMVASLLKNTDVFIKMYPTLLAFLLL